MDRARHRKSKSASGIEGIRQSQKQKTASRLSSDSRAHIDGSNKDDMVSKFLLELGHSSSGRGTGAPMKQLLAQEMSKEVDSKRRSPSVIARLMGLEGMPSPRNIIKQSKRLQESNKPRTQRSSQLYDGRSNGRDSMDQQEYKDVYEDLEASHILDRHYSSRWRYKRLSIDEELQYFKDLDFTSGHIPNLKQPSKNAKYEGNSRASRVKRKDDLLLETQNHHRSHLSHDSSKIRLEEKNEKKILPMRIVVLKPNLGKVPDSGITSSDHSHDYLPNLTKMKDNIGYSKPMSDEAREKAKEIIRRMRHDWDWTIDYRSSGFRGYAGDESSYDAYGSDDSESDTEVSKLPSRKSFDDKNRCRNPSYSLVCEMLAIPDRETRPKHLNAKINGTPSRSRSLPSSIGKKYQRSTYRDSLPGVNENVRWKEESSSNDSKSMRKKPLPCPHSVINVIDSSSEAKFKIEMEKKIKKDSFGKQPVFRMASRCDTLNVSVSDGFTMDSENGSSMTLPSKPSELLSESVVDNESTTACEREGSILQEPHKGPPERDCSEISKDFDHPSPVSVLEIPFTKHITSTSESFERVSAELRELRLQLQLLKMESGSYDEEEAAEQSPMAFERDDTLEEADGNWESSYILDVLIESGFEYSGLDIFKTIWHSPECPLDPGLFDNLEKKYSDCTIGSKCERKLLFDRINSEFLEIFWKHVDSCPWVMPKIVGFCSDLQKERVEESFEKLIRGEFFYSEISGDVLDREMQWLDCSKEEIELIGNEIEKLLIDDMVAEAVYVINS